MPTFKPSPPEKEQVSLLLSDANLEITQFTEYSFISSFLNATDGFSFTVGFERLSPEMQEALVPGAAVKLSLNGRVQASGYIDSIEKTAARGSGTEWRIEGRDRLGQVADACADPTQSFKESQTLIDALKSLFGRYGWPDDINFSESNDVNVELKTGKTRRSKTRTSDAKGFGRKALKQYKLHQLRPYTREGVLEFAHRITQRFGLWLWLSADGNTVIAAEPDFDSEPSHKLFRNSRGETNVLDGSVKFNLTSQPTHIVADSYTQAGEFGRGRAKVILPNATIRIKGYEDDGDKAVPELQKYINAGAKVLGGPTFPSSTSMIVPKARVLYLHDDESQTPEHLEAFARREMGLLQRQGLTVNYTVEGHGQNTDDGFIPWTVDTTVDVEDEVAGLTERLYVLGRTLNKSRSGGTTTELDLIRLNTMSFTDTGR